MFYKDLHQTRGIQRVRLFTPRIFSLFLSLVPLSELTSAVRPAQIAIHYKVHNNRLR